MDKKNDDKIYFTVTGLFNLPTTEFIKEGMEVKLVKDPDNDYDNEAIEVRMDGLGKIGYVANSIKSVVGESYSAGRLYDKFDKEAKGVVKYNLCSALLCEFKK